MARRPSARLGSQANLTRRDFVALAGAAATGLLSSCTNPPVGVAGPDVPGGEAPTDAASATAPEPSGRISLLSLATVPDEQAYAANASPYRIEPGLAGVDMPDDHHLSEEARKILEEQGFVVVLGYGDEFWPVYEENRYRLHANLVTVDSMMHTYHLYFQYLLRKLEEGGLSAALLRMGQELLSACQDQLSVLAGTEWEAAATRSLAFAGVGCALLDPSTPMPREVAGTVAEEVGRIGEAAGPHECAITGKQLDYSQFRVRGYYEQSEALQRYFRAMTWYGLPSFVQGEEELDRTALLLTLALDGDARGDWQTAYAVTSFFVGVADDNGYYEYLPAIREAYGDGAGVTDLPGNDDAWQRFHGLTAQMPAPQINSLPGSSARATDEDRGFRLMGQRFTIDAHIFQMLVYDNVGITTSGSRRLLPDALDVPAALGSERAYDILNQVLYGTSSPYASTLFPGYIDNLEQLKAEIAAKGDTFWQASLYNQWLHALMPLLEIKGTGYPTFMRGETWALHNVESFLGSYAELKHDTILYAKQAMAEGDGPIAQERDDRGYVEAEPLVFDRLGRLCAATAQGLAHFGLIDSQDAESLDILCRLAGQLATIAGKELADELPTDEEFELIRSMGEQLEHFWRQVHEEEAERLDLPLAAMQFPAAVIADVATGGDECLEVGTGKVSTLHAVVPVAGTLRLASGPVFTFHEFAWPASDRLTDTTWREMVRDSMYSPTEATETEPWTHLFRTR